MRFKICLLVITTL